jgi:hypothetical protein
VNLEDIVRKGNEWNWQRIVYSLLQAVMNLWMPRQKFWLFLYLHTEHIVFSLQQKHRLFLEMSVSFYEPLRTSSFSVLSTQHIYEGKEKLPGLS